MSLDELVKDIDVQDVREKNLTEQKVASMFSDIQTLKDTLRKIWKIVYYGTWILLAVMAISFVIHLMYPDIEWLWRAY